MSVNLKVIFKYIVYFTCHDAKKYVILINVRKMLKLCDLNVLKWLYQYAEVMKNQILISGNT